MKLAERQAEARKGEVTCQECFSAIAHQKVRCCRTCNTPSSGQICSDCCVENHNGHELVALVKYFEQQCKELIDTAEEHRNTVASLQTKIETQHEDINLLLSKIQSLVHILRQTLDHKATSIAQDLNDVGAENKLDILQQQKTSELGLFSSTEAILNEIVVFNDQILAIETAAIDKLNVTAERERGGSNEEYLSAFALNDDEQSSTHSAFHSLDSMRENMEAVQAEAAASCSAEGKDLISLANEATSTNETKVECNGDIEEVIANYSYVAQKDDELTLQKGERINVTEKPEQHWWIGRLQDGRIGYFPSNYVMPVTPLSSWT
uniref:SH3 domain-containing protein n=1 Tax=Plectus sambesii TaxID=2011161 RepID=A0A914XBJ3_9BILA